MIRMGIYPLVIHGINEIEWDFIENNAINPP